MPFIKLVFQTQLKMQNSLEVNPIIEGKPSLSPQSFTTKTKTLGLKYLFEIKKIVHSIHLAQPYDSAQYESDPNAASTDA
jgi:hypothetical protein